MKKTIKPHKAWPKSAYLYKIRPYNYDVWVFGSKENFLNAARLCDYGPRTADDLDGIEGLFLTTRVRDTNTVVWMLGVFDERPATLVHELGHMTFRLFDNIQADASECNNEPFCYELGNAFDEISEVLFG